MSIGTLLKFEFQLKDESRLIHGVGRVVWKREGTDGGEEKPPGMGIKFIKMDSQSRALVERIAAKRGDAPGEFEEGRGRTRTKTQAFFPAPLPQDQLPPPEDSTQVRHASEFLAEALSAGDEDAAKEAAENAEKARKRTEEIAVERAAAAKAAKDAEKAAVVEAASQAAAEKEAAAQAAIEADQADQAEADEAEADEAEADEAEADEAEADKAAADKAEADDAEAAEAEQAAREEAEKKAARREKEAAAASASAAKAAKAAKATRATSTRAPEEPASMMLPMLVGIIAVVGLVYLYVSQNQGNDTARPDLTAGNVGTEIVADDPLVEDPIVEPEIEPDPVDEVDAAALVAQDPEDPTTAPAGDERVMVSVSMSSTPAGARVEIGGLVAGETPFTTEMPVGETVEIVLRKDGYVSGVETVTPEADQGRLRFTLERVPYVVIADVSPSDARIASGGVRADESGTIVLTRPPRGPVTVNVRKAGFLSGSERILRTEFVLVDERMVARVSIILERLPPGWRPSMTRPATTMDTTDTGTADPTPTMADPEPTETPDPEPTMADPALTTMADPTSPTMARPARVHENPF
ncbi:MAG: PEGA domain-containing protein [Deltaproteobacteria bacterium]|nr:PEGA domain-containing protein [Deltaproteobacteria bacterium]